MDEPKVHNQTIDDGDERYSYSPFFTETSIPNRGTRIIDVSTNQWDIGETCALSLNFDLIQCNNPEVLDQVKYLMAHYVKSKSPDHALAIFGNIKAFLNSCDHLDGETGDDLAESFADELLNYFVANRKASNERGLSDLRLIYRLGARMGLPLFLKNVANALRKIKLKGHDKGLDVRVHIEGRSPLNSIQLESLKNIMKRHQDKFAVGEANFWRLAATWVFIVLGIRPVQLRMLMVTDLVMNTDKETGKVTYLLLVPSAKKRLEKPRSRFKRRPIPAFLGELLRQMKERNIKRYVSQGYDESMVPLFIASNGSECDRKKRARPFALILDRTAVTYAFRDLISVLNKYQRAAGHKTFDLHVTPRRLRKTFATQAAAMGIEAMLLMELLDHEDMQHVMIYYQLGANFAVKLNRVYREGLGDLIDCFKGEITFQELNEKNRKQQVFGPASLRRLVGIGLCSKDARCRLAPPYSCYGCTKFEACNNKELHIEVLNAMENEVQEQFDAGATPAKYEIEHLNACRDLIGRLETQE